MTASATTATPAKSSFTLSPQMTFLITAAASLLLGYLFYSMVIQPKQQAITDLNTEIAQRQATLAKDQSEAAQVLPLQTQVTELEQERDRFVQALPATANFGQVVADLRQTIGASGVALSSLNFASNPQSNVTLPAGVRPIGMTMEIEGQFAQIFDVLRNLELQGRFTDVSSVSLSRREGQNAQGQVQLGRLNGSLGLTVYTFDAAQAAGAGTTPVPGAAGTAAPSAPAAGAPTTPAPAAPAPAAPAPGGN